MIKAVIPHLGLGKNYMKRSTGAGALLIPHQEWKRVFIEVEAGITHQLGINKWAMIIDPNLDMNMMMASGPQDVETLGTGGAPLTTLGESRDMAAGVVIMEGIGITEVNVGTKYRPTEVTWAQIKWMLIALLGQ